MVTLVLAVEVINTCFACYPAICIIKVYQSVGRRSL